MKTHLAIGALLITLSCDGATGVIPGELAVRVTPPVLQLTNHSSAPAYVFAIERGLAIRALWTPCSDPPRCLAVGPKATMDLPYSQIAGYHEGAQTAIVNWWYLIPGGTTGFRPDSIRAVRVRL
jgi:hypothetical protein